MSASIVYSGLLIIVLCLVTACAPRRAVVDDVRREVGLRQTRYAHGQERRTPQLARAKTPTPRRR